MRRANSSLIVAGAIVLWSTVLVTAPGHAADMSCAATRERFEMLAAVSGLLDPIFPNSFAPYDYEFRTSNIHGMVSCDADGTIAVVSLCVGMSLTPPPEKLAHFKRGMAVVFAAVHPDAAEHSQDLFRRAKQSLESGEHSVGIFLHGDASAPLSGGYFAAISFTAVPDRDYGEFCAEVYTE